MQMNIDFRGGFSDVLFISGPDLKLVRNSTCSICIELKSVCILKLDGYYEGILEFITVGHSVYRHLDLVRILSTGL